MVRVIKEKAKEVEKSLIGLIEEAENWLPHAKHILGELQAAKVPNYNGLFYTMNELNIIENALDCIWKGRHEFDEIYSPVFDKYKKISAMTDQKLKENFPVSQIDIEEIVLTEEDIENMASNLN